MLTKNSLIYLVGRVVPAGLALLVILAYSHLLTPAEYGTVALVSAGVQLAWAGLFLPLCQAALRFCHSPADERRFLPSLVQIHLAAAAALAVVAAALAPLGDAEQRRLVLVGLLLLYATAWLELQLHLQMSRSDAAGYVRQSVVRSAASSVLGYLFAWLGWGAPGVLLGMSVGIVLPSIVFGTFRVDPGRLSALDRATLAQLWSYAAPLMLSVSLAALADRCDRLIIALFHGQHAVGLYAIGHDIATRILHAIGGPIGAAALPLAVRALETRGEAEARRQLAENVRLLAGIAVPAAAGLAAVSPLLAGLAVGPEYREAATIVLPIAAAGALVLTLRRDYFDHALQIAKRTTLFVRTTATVLALSVALNPLLIPLHPLAGPAMAFLAAQAGGLVVGAAMARRSFPVPVPLGDLARIALAALVMLGAILALPTGPNPELDFVLQVATGGLAYLLCVLAFDIGGVRRLLQRRLRPVAAVPGGGG